MTWSRGGGASGCGASNSWPPGGGYRRDVADADADVDAPPPTAYRMGDDVIHAAFGDGVVIGTEPGEIVVIRFAGDRSERKLVAALAPIIKR